LGLLISIVVWWFYQNEDAAYPLNVGDGEPPMALQITCFNKKSYHRLTPLVALKMISGCQCLLTHGCL
jgi:hypothetical protein